MSVYKEPILKSVYITQNEKFSYHLVLVRAEDAEQYKQILDMDSEIRGKTKDMFRPNAVFQKVYGKLLLQCTTNIENIQKAIEIRLLVQKNQVIDKSTLPARARTWHASWPKKCYDNFIAMEFDPDFFDPSTLSGKDTYVSAILLSVLGTENAHNYITDLPESGKTRTYEKHALICSFPAFVGSLFYMWSAEKERKTGPVDVMAINICKQVAEDTV